MTKGLYAMRETEPESTEADANAGADQVSGQAIEQIRTALRGLKYGTLSIIVQDGVVIQLERTEKIRLRKGRR